MSCPCPWLEQISWETSKLGDPGSGSAPFADGGIDLKDDGVQRVGIGPQSAGLCGYPSLGAYSGRCLTCVSD